MNRENNFTIIHILAALMVITGHQFILLGGEAPSVMGVAIHGLGVRILFLVSGYLVSMSYLRTKSRRGFIWKRLSRLYPALAVCLILSAVIMRFLTSVPEYYWQSAWQYVAHNLELRPKFDIADVFRDNIYQGTVNGSLWTLPIEVACYLLLIPFLDVYRAIAKKNASLSKLLFLCILVALSIFECYYELNMSGKTAILWATDWYRAVSLLIYFIIGSGFYVMDLKRYCNWQIAVVAVLFLMCVDHALKIFMTPFVAGYTVLCFALADKALFSHTLENRDVCYGLYLYAMPVQQVLIQLLYVRMGLHWSVYFYLILTVIIAWILAEISLKYIEIPCAKISNHILKKLER